MTVSELREILSNYNDDLLVGTHVEHGIPNECIYVKNLEVKLSKIPFTTSDGEKRLVLISNGTGAWV